MRNPTSRLAAVLMLAFSDPVFGHEFWVEPKEFQGKSSSLVVAELRNGEDFKGARLPYFPERTVTTLVAEGTEGGKIYPYAGRLGDLPAIDVLLPSDGLWVIAHQTAPETITYENLEKFVSFAQSKGYPDISVLRREPLSFADSVVEVYSRFAKSLLYRGQVEGKDRRVGFELELLALDNPYQPETRMLSIQLLLNGSPLQLQQVEIFERFQDGTVLKSRAPLNSDGMTQVALSPSREYLVNAVLLREAAEGSAHQWETLWASLTFATPSE